MEIRTLEVAGFAPAIKAMRNPMNSWSKSDSCFDDPFRDDVVGTADRDLSERLQKAGPEHCKHLRMIQVWADITAPFYWHKQLDTYRFGVEKVSCSTMHKLTSRPLTVDDFEMDGEPTKHDLLIIDTLNEYIDFIRNSTEPDNEKQTAWRTLVRMLPEGYLQTRTVMFSYAALRNIYKQRKGHKLKEWEIFRAWVESLPESWMITDAEPNRKEESEHA